MAELLRCPSCGSGRVIPNLDGIYCSDCEIATPRPRQTEYDPADVEYMARLLCKALNYSPDKYDTLIRLAANRALDWMQANGVKMTTRECEPHEREYVWQEIHDAATLTPRSNDEER